MTKKELKRENHYVPIWYQKGFTENGGSLIEYLDLEDKRIDNPKGEITVTNKPKKESVKNAFCIRDLYSTFFGFLVSDEIEDKLFGEVDTKGSRAVKAFIKGEPKYMHERFMDFFDFIDIQKLRTPKGLDWINKNYSDLDQNSLLIEMQALRKMNMSTWMEGVREIVSAKKSSVKFIVSDHPVTTYNYSIHPKQLNEEYPNEPAIVLKATQTIFPLNMDECLIFTNYEFADNPDNIDPTEARTNPKYMKESIVHTQNLIRDRELDENEVSMINYLIKNRAKKFIAAAKKEWLYPEKIVSPDWTDIKEVLLPSKHKTGLFGGEMIMQYEDGTTKYQDAFGRSEPVREFLQKNIDESQISLNHSCGCGSAYTYGKCCKDKKKEERSSWKELSIRERNMALVNAISNILGITEGKNWDDVRRELSPEQVKEIYKFYDSLWPLDTDIVSLLPKKDGKLRVLYMGIVDGDLADNQILGLTAYFDEIMIQNPMPHPRLMAKEFNPIQHPEDYLQQTLKFVFLMIRLAPYIESGIINLFPDPGNFNRYLKLSSLNAAEERHKDYGFNFDIEREDFFTQEAYDRFQKRNYLGLSDEVALSFLFKDNPTASEKEQEEYLHAYRTLTYNDPQILLQEDTLKNSKQMLMMSLTPTVEMALFICQVTGSILFTHSKTRWDEVKRMQAKELGIVTYNHQKLTSFINSFSFKMTQNIMKAFNNRDNKNFLRLRELLLNVKNSIENNPPCEDKRFLKSFKSSLKKCYNKLDKNWEEEKDLFTYDFKFELLVPYKGIENQKVQRLILQNLGRQYDKSVPIAIFISV